MLTGLYRGVRTLFVACSVLLLSTAIGSSQEERRLFCVADLGGGVAYDAKSAEWVSAGLNVKDRFILSYARIEDDKGDAIEYRMKMTESGHKSPYTCASVYMFRPDQLSCMASLFSLKFNTENNRFIRAYMAGYIDGDRLGNTPAVVAGTCTPID